MTCLFGNTLKNKKVYKLIENVKKLSIKMVRMCILCVFIAFHDLTFLYVIACFSLLNVQNFE